MRERLNLPPAWDGNLWICGHLGRARPVHRHAELEFNLVTQGAGTYLLANRRYRIGPGDLLWLFPGQEHVLVEETADFQMWVGVFRPRMVRRVATDPGSRVLGLADPPGEYCRRLGRGELERLVGLLAEVEATRDRPGLFNTGSAYALMATWRAFEGAVDVPVADVHPAVEKAARLIRSDPGTLRLDELAHRSGLSPSRLSRLFKSQTGIAWVDFRNRERIKRFLGLYGSGQRRNVLDAALQAGFGSYPQFHRVYRRLMGCTPASSRKRPAK